MSAATLRHFWHCFGDTVTSSLSESVIKSIRSTEILVVQDVF